ncbi:heterokaryon incompatibility protein-domain-containing protein [Xylaria grammica]|nr:heterokaryon incompatibility protein-domain-containing protein [Xylaria grammica]
MDDQQHELDPQLPEPRRRDGGVPQETAANPPSNEWTGMTNPESEGVRDPAPSRVNSGYFGVVMGNAPAGQSSGFAPSQPGQPTATNGRGDANADIPGNVGDAPSRNMSKPLAAQRGRRGKAGQSTTKRPLAPRAVETIDGSLRVPVMSTIGNTQTMEWLRTTDSAPAPTAISSGHFTVDPDATPFFSTLWAPGRGPSGRRDQDTGTGHLSSMTQQARDGIQKAHEDTRAREMRRERRHIKRLRTNLGEINGVLRDLQGKVDSLFSHLNPRQPEASETPRFEARNYDMYMQQTYSATAQQPELSDVPRFEAPFHGAVQQRFATARRPEVGDMPWSGASSDEQASRMDHARRLGIIQSSSFVSSSVQDAIATSSVDRSADDAHPAVPHTKRRTLENIRLLRLSSANPIEDDGTNATSVRNYSLTDFCFAECPAYIALSYVWGDQRFTSTISVNGKSVQVRNNLARALSSIQVSNPDAYLWADAVCINQKDPQERSRLVPHMGEIFANARSVYAWLGPIERIAGDVDTGTLFTHLSDLGTLFWEHAGAEHAERLNEHSLDLDEILRKSLPVLFSRFTDPLGQSGLFPTEEYTAFSYRAFWKRIWVLQEVFLAKDLHFLCGDRRLASKHLAGAVILLENFQQHLIHRQGISREQMKSTQSHLEKFVYGSSVFPEMHRVIIYTSIYPPDVVSLRIAMTNFCVKELPRGSSATDPRDMIFGLLGFANDAERSYIRPDYSKTVQESYVTATRALIKNGFSDILAWAQPPDSKKITNLPSWVPDYSATIYESLCSQAQAKPWLPRFKACGRHDKYSDEKAHSFDHLTLPVFGHRVDEVRSVGRLWFPRSSRSGGASLNSSENTGPEGLIPSVSYEALLFFLKEIEDFVKRAEALHRGQKSNNIEKKPRFDADAKWRVPCCDQLVLDGRLVRGDPSAQSRYDATRQGAEACIADPGAELPAHARPYAEALLRWVDRRPFLTSNGFVGLGPARIEVRDTVAVLDGFSACYLLRAHADGHRVVGEAFVSGYMDGETVGSTPKNAGSHLYEWFYLQ